jgi:hypothetical protein
MMDQILSKQIAKISELISTERLQFAALLSISLIIVGFTGILYFRHNLFLQSFIGRFNPLIAVSLVVLLGIGLLTFLLWRGWFDIYGNETIKGLSISLVLGSVLALVAILVDLRFVFQEDMNVAFPDSLLFYPIIGYVVEILFHVLPLTCLLVLLTFLLKTMEFERVVWICILIVSLLEPIFQLFFGSSSQNPLWSKRFVVLQVFLINLFQLYIFKRYDFVSMYSFRLVYYLFWHIIWGYLRLGLLF